MEHSTNSDMDKSQAGPSNPTDTAGTKLHDKTDLDQKTNIRSNLTYRTKIKKRRDLNIIKYDYSRIRRTCRCFDEKDDLSKPIHFWFWPDKPRRLENTNSDNSASSESDSDEEKNEEEIYICPEELQRRIYLIAQYLREKYNYCPWCGFQYDDEKDLEDGCPGRTREDHEGYSQTTFSDYEDED